MNENEKTVLDNINIMRQEFGFDDRYALPNGMIFTYKMFTDFCMYFDFIEDLHDKYGTSSLLELRKKLGIG